MSENKTAKTPTDDGHVAHVYLFEKTGRPKVAWDNAKDIKLGDRLYVAPKQWVGLTDEELAEIDGVVMKYIGTGEYVIDGEYEFARAVEQALKEKNT
jgi:hypothetical protein